MPVSDHPAPKTGQTASRAVEPAVPTGTGANQADKRPASVAQRQLQSQIDGSGLVQRRQQQQARIQAVSAQSGAPVQRFALKGSQDYQGFLSGDALIRAPQNVKYFVNRLRNGLPLPVNGQAMKATPEMAWEPTAENADIFKPLPEDGDENAEGVIKKRVLIDGHHRFVAHAEAGVALPSIAISDDETTEGRYWRAVGSIDYSPEEAVSSAPAAAERKQAPTEKKSVKTPDAKRGGAKKK